MDNICISKEWELVADRIKQNAKTCIVLGSVNSGKSTFCKFLVQKWTASKICVGYIDSDLGQSTLGLPTTVSMKVFRDPPYPDDYSRPNGLHFVGNTSPEGFLLQTLHALRIMVDTCFQQGSEIALIDTTGFIDGPVARILKFYKIEMLKPQWIIALQAQGEIEHLLRGYERMGWRIIRLASSKQVIVRSQAERQKYRSEKYRAYFKRAMVIQYPVTKLVFPSSILGAGQRVYPADVPKEILANSSDYWYMEKSGSELLIVADHADTILPADKLKKFFGIATVICINKSELKDLLVGLHDRRNNTLGLGTIVDLDPTTETLTLFTPVQDTHKIVTVHLGALKIEQGGNETGKIRVIRYV